MSMPSDVTPDVMDAMEADRPRDATPTRNQLTPEQRGWAVAAFVAFLGVAFIGPAAARALNPKRSMKDRLTRQAHDARKHAAKAGARAQERVRRLGGGSFWR